MKMSTTFGSRFNSMFLLTLIWHYIAKERKKQNEMLTIILEYEIEKNGLRKKFRWKLYRNTDGNGVAIAISGISNKQIFLK